jgi:uncharacterized caspase-like protein
MKSRLLLIFAVCVFAFNSIQAQNVKKFAVVVGCADYQMQGLDLRYSDDDAYRYYAYLLSCEGGGVPSENIAILVDEAATKQNIIKTMHDIYAKAGPNDMLIFYFSGHGSEGAFCPDDVSEQYSSLLTHEEIKAVFKQHPAKYKICFADACYSGSIYEGKPETAYTPSSQQETSIVIMMSSDPTETSAEHPKIRQGAFTYYLLKGLKGSADRNKDNVVTLEELFPYVKANVLQFTSNQQTPIIEGNASRDMPIGTIN